MKSSITPSTEKESTTNDNGSSTDEAESEGNNRLAKAWAKIVAIFQARREVSLQYIQCTYTTFRHERTKQLIWKSGATAFSKSCQAELVRKL